MQAEGGEGDCEIQEAVEDQKEGDLDRAFVDFEARGHRPGGAQRSVADAAQQRLDDVHLFEADGRRPEPAFDFRQVNGDGMDEDNVVPQTSAQSADDKSERHFLSDSSDDDVKAKRIGARRSAAGRSAAESRIQPPASSFAKSLFSIKRKRDAEITARTRRSRCSSTSPRLRLDSSKSFSEKRRASGRRAPGLREMRDDGEHMRQQLYESVCRQHEAEKRMRAGEHESAEWRRRCEQAEGWIQKVEAREREAQDLLRELLQERKESAEAEERRQQVEAEKRRQQVESEERRRREEVPGARIGLQSAAGGTQSGASAAEFGRHSRGHPFDPSASAGKHHSGGPPPRASHRRSVGADLRKCFEDLSTKPKVEEKKTADSGRLAGHSATHYTNPYVYSVPMSSTGLTGASGFYPGSHGSAAAPRYFPCSSGRVPVEPQPKATGAMHMDVSAMAFWPGNAFDEVLDAEKTDFRRWCFRLQKWAHSYKLPDDVVTHHILAKCLEWRLHEALDTFAPHLESASLRDIIGLLAEWCGSKAELAAAAEDLLNLTWTKKDSPRDCLCHWKFTVAHFRKEYHTEFSRSSQMSS